MHFLQPAVRSGFFMAPRFDPMNLVRGNKVQQGQQGDMGSQDKEGKEQQGQRGQQGQQE